MGVSFETSSLRFEPSPPTPVAVENPVPVEVKSNPLPSRAQAEELLLARREKIETVARPNPTNPQTKLEAQENLRHYLWARTYYFAGNLNQVTFRDQEAEQYIAQAVAKGTITNSQASTIQSAYYRLLALETVDRGLRTPDLQRRSFPIIEEAKAMGALRDDEVAAQARAREFDEPPGNRSQRGWRIAGFKILKWIGLAIATPILGAIAGPLFVLGAIMFPVPIPGSTAIFWLPAGAIFSPVENLWNAEPVLGKDRTPSTPALIIERRKEANRAWLELWPAAAAR